jgi:hypothetical protein
VCVFSSWGADGGQTRHFFYFSVEPNDILSAKHLVLAWPTPLGRVRPWCPTCNACPRQILFLFRSLIRPYIFHAYFVAGSPYTSRPYNMLTYFAVQSRAEKGNNLARTWKSDTENWAVCAIYLADTFGPSSPPPPADSDGLINSPSTCYPFFMFRITKKGTINPKK